MRVRELTAVFASQERPVSKLIDYILNFGKAQNAWLLIPIGIMYGFIYYFLFSLVIKRWNLRTPGREDDEVSSETEPAK